MADQKQTMADTLGSFNPFTHLTVEQTAALVTRLNPQWKAEYAEAVKLAAGEHKVSDSEATILVWLRSTADDSIEARNLTAKLTSGKAMLLNVAAGSLASLALIAEDYKSLPATSVRAYRIGIRDAIYSKHAGETALRILGKVMTACNVQPESAWQR